MITDSPYESGELVVRPSTGILGGLIGSGFMLLSVLLLEPLSHLSLPDMLHAYGKASSYLAGPGFSNETSRLAAGAVFIILNGSVLGLFYALCEQCIPKKGLFTDGVFYGFFIWVLGGFIMGPFMGKEIYSITRSWPVLASSLVYGIGLSIFAIWSKSGCSTAPVLPQD